ncbi:MAG: hypothetical protein H7A04_12550 [Pseudomonadales bacterium]|nr:hypothetical protein [Pseudomonadales bacterium]
MTNEEVETVLNAKRNIGIYRGSTILVSLLLLIGIVCVWITYSGPISIFIAFIMTLSMNHVLGSAGFITWRPLGKKRAPIPYNQLFNILSRELYKDADSIRHAANINERT